MKTGLEKLKLRDFCRTGQERSVTLDGALLPRLQQTLIQPLATPVAVRLTGSETAQADGSLLQELRVYAQADARLQCQRCLEAFEQRLTIDTRFVLVDDDDAALAWDELHADDDIDGVPAFEPLVASAAFNAVELIEDELLLSLPLVPRHDVCPQELVPGLLGAGVDSVHDIREADDQADGFAGDRSQIKLSPFAALQALKKKPD